MEHQQLLKIEGPFDEGNQIVQYISRKQTYEYRATFSKIPTQETIKQLHWIVNYDEKKSKQLINAPVSSSIVGQTICAQLQLNKGVKKLKITAYIDTINPSITPIEVDYKQVVTFFIGGAGDATSYYGAGPHYVMRDYVKIPFEQSAPKEGHLTRYLGYADVYGLKKIRKNILAFLPNKGGTSVNIIGFSLGAWNGAHLSQILTNQGYKVNVLITLDPVGINIGVKLISNIYWNVPQPIANYWINTYTNPPRLEGDDLVARAGGQWIPTREAVHVLHETAHHHKEAGLLFYDLIQPTVSAATILLHFIHQYLDTK